MAGEMQCRRMDLRVSLVVEGERSLAAWGLGRKPGGAVTEAGRQKV